MDGCNIALWQSHGRYYDAAEDRWKWQRCRLFGTVEDLYTRSYVIPFLVPMLENAGAYVMLPRERDSSEFEIVIDADGPYCAPGYHERNGKQKWKQSAVSGFGAVKPTLEQGDNPFRSGHAREVKAVKHAAKASKAEWSAPIADTGEYAVYVSYPSTDKSCPDVTYTVHTATGDRHVKVDQRMGGSTWMYLGTFPFRKSEQPHALVSLTNVSTHEGIVGADAVRIGGGMGHVARGVESPRVSGMPRWAEASRYYLQYAGMPDSVYAHEDNDYRDDIFCRPMWVNHLKNELNIPIDLVMAFHSDAGTEEGDKTVGTLGIYYTRRKSKFPDGRPRALSGELATDIVNSVVNDIRAAYEPDWVQRPLRDRSYIEARIPEVPSMLLELLSHQNFADMKYGLDPQFKFDVSRAVYKGILRYLANRGRARYVVAPLAPNSFEIKEGGKAGSYNLAWSPTADPLETTAVPSGYIVEERTGSDPAEPFREIARVTAPRYEVEIPKGEIRSYRIIAINGGGHSFPSEILAAGWSKAGAETVTVVNGFTRVSAPDNFSSGSMAGFGLYEPGVPMGHDLSYTGAQYDFERSHQWVHDDEPGFGASRADMETRPVGGNTFDFVLTHGIAVMQSGRSFVSSSVAAFEEDYDNTPQIIDLIMGLQKETVIGRGVRPAAHAVFSTSLQNRLLRLADMGVPMFISGSYIASDPWRDENSREFVRKVFGYDYHAANASASGRVSEVRSRFIDFGAGDSFSFSIRPGEMPYAVTAPDAIVPADKGSGATIMRYDRNQVSAAMANVGSAHRTVAMGFPFEAITSGESRGRLMNQILDFLTRQ